eukprot:6024882-Alexandrium_andersonii.AAC.2
MNCVWASVNVVETQVGEARISADIRCTLTVPATKFTDAQHKPTTTPHLRYPTLSTHNLGARGIVLNW